MRLINAQYAASITARSAYSCNNRRHAMKLIRYRQCAAQEKPSNRPSALSNGPPRPAPATNETTKSAVAAALPKQRALSNTSAWPRASVCPLPIRGRSAGSQSPRGTFGFIIANSLYGIMTARRPLPPSRDTHDACPQLALTFQPPPRSRGTRGPPGGPRARAPAAGSSVWRAHWFFRNAVGPSSGRRRAIRPSKIDDQQTIRPNVEGTAWSQIFRGRVAGLRLRALLYHKPFPTRMRGRPAALGLINIRDRSRQNGL